MANQIVPMSKLRKFLKLSLEGKSLRQMSVYYSPKMYPPV
jgi:hypothetical protein